MIWTFNILVNFNLSSPSLSQKSQITPMETTELNLMKFEVPNNFWTPDLSCLGWLQFSIAMPTTSDSEARTATTATFFSHLA